MNITPRQRKLATRRAARKARYERVTSHHGRIRAAFPPVMTMWCEKDNFVVFDHETRVTKKHPLDF